MIIRSVKKIVQNSSLKAISVDYKDESAEKSILIKYYDMNNIVYWRCHEKDEYKEDEVKIILEQALEILEGNTKNNDTKIISPKDIKIIEEILEISYKNIRLSYDRELCEYRIKRCNSDKMYRELKKILDRYKKYS